MRAPNLKSLAAAFVAAALFAAFLGRLPVAENARLVSGLRAHEARVTVRWIGCRNASDLDRVRTLLAQFDVRAAAQFSAANHCRPFEPGQTGQIEQTSEWTASTCMRADGDLMFLAAGGRCEPRAVVFASRFDNAPCH
jgi:hypothetical protein